MHHRNGLDYQAANVGWLWKRRHVYTGGQSDTNFTGTREINVFGDSQAVGLVTDRYRFTWIDMLRYRLPDSRWILWRRKLPSNRNGTTTVLGTPSLTFEAHSSLLLTTSQKKGGLVWSATTTNQTSQSSTTDTIDFPTLISGIRDLVNDSTEAVALKI
jgi:hypothetical protein